MNSSDVDRLRNDLGTMRAVIGMELPFDRFDVRATLIVGCSALLPVVVAIAGVESRWLLLGSAAPFLAALLITLGRNYRAAHPSKACPLEKRKEYRIGVPLMILCLPLFVGFHIWATQSGAPAEVANGSILMFLGIMLLVEGLGKSDRRAALFPAIAAIVGGLSWPFCDHLELWKLLWSCTGVALIGAAAVRHRQLVIRNQPDDRSY